MKKVGSSKSHRENSLDFWLLTKKKKERKKERKKKERRNGKEERVTQHLLDFQGKQAVSISLHPHRLPPNVAVGFSEDTTRLFTRPASTAFDCYPNVCKMTCSFSSNTIDSTQHQSSVSLILSSTSAAIHQAGIPPQIPRASYSAAPLSKDRRNGKKKKKKKKKK